MSIKVDCDNCKAVFNVNEKLAWKKGKCPKCHNPLEVPTLNNEIDLHISDTSNEVMSEKQMAQSSENPKKNVEKVENNNKKKKGKWIKFILLVLLLLISWIWAYWYYIYQENPDDNIIVNNDLYKTYVLGNSNEETGIEEVVLVEKTKVLDKSKDLNYSFNISSNYELISWEEPIWKWFFNIDDAKIISKEWGLKQQIKLTKVSWQNFYKDEKLQFIVEDIDFLSDYEKIYFFVWKWYEHIFNENSSYNILKSWKATKDTLSKIKNIFKEEEYVMQDNWKTLLNSIWDISNNKLLSWIVKWMSTSNPMSYFIKEWIDKDLSEYVKSDLFLFYLLQEIKSSKNKYEINNEICDNLWPILSNLSFNWIDWNLINNPSFTKSCSKKILYLNSLIWYFDNINIEWDKDKWDFKIAFIKEEKELISLEYKTHKLNSWNIDLDNDWLLFEMTWNCDSILTSNILINTELSWMTINSKIIDWVWNIDLKWEKISSEMIISNYNVDSYIFSYNNSWLELNSKYTKWIFSFDIYSTPSLLEWKYSYNNWKINGFIKVSENISYVFNWNYNNIEDFNFDIVDDNIWNQFTISAKQNLELTDYSFISKLKWVENILLLAKLSKDIAEDETINYNLSWDIKYSSPNDEENLGEENLGNDTELENKKIKLFDEVDSLETNSGRVAILETPNVKQIDSKITFNISLDLKSLWAEYKLPSNYKEIGINKDEMLILPDFTWYKSIDKNKIMTFWAVWVWLFATSIWLEWYWVDIDKSQTLNDIDKITTIIESELAKQTSLIKMLVKNEDYKWNNISIWWQKLVFWQNYSVWSLDYNFLWIDKDEYLNPDWWEYLIWVSTLRDNSYQILSEINNGWWIKEYVIKWNYNPNEFKVLRITEDYTIDEAVEWELTKSITLTSDRNLWLFRKWDIIWWKKVIQVWSLWLNITFDKVIKSNSILLKPDAKTLIYIDWKAIEDWDIVEDYKN